MEEIFYLRRLIPNVNLCIGRRQVPMDVTPPPTKHPKFHLFLHDVNSSCLKNVAVIKIFHCTMSCYILLVF